MDLRKLFGGSKESAAKPAAMSLTQFALVMFVLTAMTAAAGAFFGLQTVSIAKGAQEDKNSASLADPAYSGTMTLKELPSIVTNLAEPKDAMIRLQAGILYDSKAVTNPDALAAQISDDILAFLTTVTSSQIEGASGLEHLREDLNDRAQVRSQGRVHELVIETLVVQ